MLDALKALLETVPGAVIQRNSVLPEKVPAGGLIILRDGDPGEPEQALSGFGSTYYQHAVEIEVNVEEGDAAARDAAFDALLQQIGAVLEADPGARRPRLRPHLWPTGAGHRGDRRRAGDQERDPLGDRRVRDRRPSFLTLPRLGIRRSGPGKQHEDQGKQAQPGTDRVQATPVDQQASTELVGRIETGILQLFVRRPHHDERERHD